ncbi:MAG TPA: phosphate ABC transporter substrate-binding protein PstS [Rugosimonospora sp.]|nr:phosphate ABC transporter substrate-binding protein PstS [Rugosimonospora sp.]
MRNSEGRARRATWALAAALLLAGCNSDANGAAQPADTAAGTNCPSGTFNGAGSSAQKTAVVAWIDAYQKMCPDVAVNYDAQGSNNGRTQFIQKQVPWAGSDASITGDQKVQADKRCAPGQAINLPMVITPIAIVYHLPGVTSLTLTPSLIARIFDGKITRWNNPQLVAVNPGIALPDKTITTVHRSADSGTSENLTRFLVAQASGDWLHKPSQTWPNSLGLGASVSTTMVLSVKNTDGAIGYVDHPDATKNALPVAALDTGNGPVDISDTAIAAVVAATKVNQNGQDITLDLAYGLHAKGAYPLLLTTYEITCSKGMAPDERRFVASFLAFTASDAGQKLLGPPGYIGLPPDLLTRVRAAVAGLNAG